MVMGPTFRMRCHLSSPFARRQAMYLRPSHGKRAPPPISSSTSAMASSSERRSRSNPVAISERVRFTLTPCWRPR